MRVYALYVVVAVLCIYAYRDWFKSLCGAIVLMAVIEHPDMPKAIMDIQGFNPWNILLLNVVSAWLIKRREQGLVWDLPRPVNILLLLYLAVVLVGFGRMMLDRAYLDDFTTATLVSEHLVNTLKWVVPGLLLFDGCRSRQRLIMGLVSLLAVYLLLAVQVIRWMPPSAALSGATLESRSRKIVQNEIGYSRVNMSMMLSGASWATLAVLPLLRRRWHQAAVVLAALAIAYGQALTGGRMGYATWMVVGVILCGLKWRKLLLLAPIAVVTIALALPGTAERMLQGFDETDLMGEEYTDDFEVTAGRTLIWPYVIDEIAEAPLLGYGRLAMVRTGLRDYLLEEYGEHFPHPHNAYLECLLDNGLVGFACIIPFYALLVFYSARQFRDQRDPWRAAVGGVTLALLLALLVAGFGSQTFYPREGAVGLWAALALCLRLVVLRQAQTAATAAPLWPEGVRGEWRAGRSSLSTGLHPAAPGAAG